MSKRKISAAIMARDEKEFIIPCVQSLINVVDEMIIVLDSRTRDGTEEIVVEWASKEPKIKVLKNKWVSGSHQKQFLKEQCTGDWILFADADEIYDDNFVRVHDVIDRMEATGKRFGNVRTHHFIFHFGAEDATHPVHYTLHRLVKNDRDLKFPKGQTHAMFNIKESEMVNIDDFRMFHYGCCKNLFRIRDKFIRNEAIKFHNPEWHQQWLVWHYFGRHPIALFRPEQHPRAVREYYRFDHFKSGEIKLNGEGMEKPNSPPAGEVASSTGTPEKK